jgi:hypothetical protein
MKHWKPKWHIGRTPKEFIYSVIMYKERANKCIGETWEHFYRRFEKKYYEKQK